MNKLKQVIQEEIIKANKYGIALIRNKNGVVEIEYHSGDIGKEVDHITYAQICPNCKSNNIEEAYSIKWYISCNDCELSSPVAETVPDAVELWNKIRIM